jgi:ubiquinone/menaquinone biosynthesis C-methylase UbiE
MNTLFRLFDRYLGRESYHPIRRRLDPQREYSQLTYGRAISSLLSAEMKWLDAGCGHSVLELTSSDEEKRLIELAGSIVGCDADLSSLQQQRTVADRCCCKLEAMPFQDSSFKLITLNMVAEHLEDPAPVFSEFARILQEDGYLLVHTPNAAGYFIRIARLARRVLPEEFIFRVIRYLEHREEKDVFPTYYRANTQQQLRQLAASAGLEEYSLRLLYDRPLFYFFAPLSVIELLLTRVMRFCGANALGATAILGLFKRRQFLSSTQFTGRTLAKAPEAAA